MDSRCSDIENSIFIFFSFILTYLIKSFLTLIIMKLFNKPCVLLNPKSLHKGLSIATKISVCT